MIVTRCDADHQLVKQQSSYRCSSVVCRRLAPRAPSLLAKAQPGKIDYAVGAVAIPPHVFALMLMREAQIDLLAISHRSSSDAIAGVLRGDVPIVFESVVLITPHIKAGKLKPLAVIGEGRSPLLPNVPALAEMGFSGLAQEAWIGLVAPAGLAPDTATGIHNAAFQALRSPELRAQYETLGWDIAAGSADAFATDIREERTTWGNLIRQKGLRLD